MKNQTVKAVACALRGNHIWESDDSDEAMEYEKDKPHTYCIICKRCGTQAVDKEDHIPHWVPTHYR